jgi:hypothetical protein
MIQSAPVCGDAGPIVMPGAWFIYESRPSVSSIVQISTCVSDTSLNGNFDSQMLVSSGSCQDLHCVQGNDNEFKGCFTEAGLSFKPSPSTTYYILVYGHDYDRVGDFAVQASFGPVRPPNNNCLNAPPLFEDEIVITMTFGAIFDNVPLCGNVFTHTTPGV